MSLRQLSLDYVAQLEHHLKQVVGKEALPYSDLPWPPPDRWQTEVDPAKPARNFSDLNS